MTMTGRDAVHNLHTKLSEGLDTLTTTKNHLEAFHKNIEDAVNIQMRTARAFAKEKKLEADRAASQLENLLEQKKAESVEAVADWKAKRDHQKLEKRAERAEEYADVCVTLALRYAAEAELAILEAFAARQDANKV